jgi:hypothetical protein
MSGYARWRCNTVRVIQWTLRSRVSTYKKKRAMYQADLLKLEDYNHGVISLDGNQRPTHPKCWIHWERWRHVVSVTDPYGRILGFLDLARYFFFQVAPQLYS